MENEKNQKMIIEWLENEKIKKWIFELLGKKNKNELLNFLFLDVSTSEAWHQMTVYWENVGYLLKFEKIKKWIFELLENEKMNYWIFNF